MRIPSEQQDPDYPEEWIPAPVAEYVYNRHVGFDWNNKKHVTQLTSWRSQHRYRNFQPLRKPRAFWVDREVGLVIYLIKQQKKTSKTIKWNRLANKFNSWNEGIVHRRGERVLTPGSKKNPVLEEDRPAPWRTASAIKTSARKWSETQHLLTNKTTSTIKSDSASDFSDFSDEPLPSFAQSQYSSSIDNGTQMKGYIKYQSPFTKTHKRQRHSTQSDSEDDEEIPDPHPEPGYVAKKARRYNKTPQTAPAKITPSKSTTAQNIRSTKKPITSVKVPTIAGKSSMPTMHWFTHPGKNTHNQRAKAGEKRKLAVIYEEDEEEEQADDSGSSLSDVPDSDNESAHDFSGAE